MPETQTTAAPDVPWRDLARALHDAAEADAMPFAESVARLAAAGFDGYAVDFRRAARTYYRPDGDSLDLAFAPAQPIAAAFAPERIMAAIRAAQAQAPGYTYRGFCAEVTAAGCAGYLVSLIGRRVVYFGRSGEIHTELFPGSAPATP